MSRFIAQMIIQGTAVFTRVFISAYQQALQNAKRGGGAAAASQAASFIRGKMQVDEASKVLDIDKKSLTKEMIEQKYKKYFDSNDPKKGGSFYLQSKIYRAREALEKSLEESKNT